MPQIEENHLGELEIESEFGEGILTTSFNLETEEVKELLAAKDWITVAIYEFMQNQVSYTKNCPEGAEFEPRVLFELEDGSKVPFDGSDDFLHVNKIKAVELVNYGTGFSPWHFLGMRHDGGEEALGKYGRGMKIAASALAKTGMGELFISSNFEGRNWKGRSFLKPLFRDKFNFLNLEYKFEGESENKTTLRYENPSPEFLEALVKMPEKFLHANPKFPGAKLIPPEKRRPVESTTVKVDKGEVSCIDEVVNAGPEYLYIDCKQFKHKGYGEKLICTWSIKGLSEPSKGRYRVVRSKNSVDYDAHYLGYVMGDAIRKIEDPNLLKKLVSTASQNPNQVYREFSCIDTDTNEMEFSDASKAAVKKIWEDLYSENTLITCDKEKTEYYKDANYRAMYVPFGLFDFLKQAGVKTLKEVTGEKASLDPMYRKIRLSFPDGATGIYKLMEMAARELGEVNLEDDKGVKKLTIKLPTDGFKTDDFSEQSESSIGKVVQVAAALSKVRGIGMETVAVGSENIYKLTFKVTDYGNRSFNVVCSVDVFDKVTSDYKDHEDGTYVTLKGADIDALEYPLDDEAFTRELNAMKSRLKGLPVLRDGAENSQRGFNFDIEMLLSILRSMGYNPSGQAIGKPKSVGISTETGTRSAEEALRLFKVREGVDIKESVMPAGYYPQTVASEFKMNEHGKAYWESVKDKKQEIHLPEGPKENFDGKIVYIDMQDGEKDLLIPEGYVLSGFNAETHPGTNLEFYIDRESGVYSVKVSGVAYKLECYIEAENPAAYYKRSMGTWPEGTDYKNFAGNNIPEDLREFVRTASELDIDSKIAASQSVWASRFTYTNKRVVEGVNMTEEEYAKHALAYAEGNCGYAASGGVILDRAIGLASRVCGGYIVRPDGSIVSHAWKRVWIGHEWVSIEPQIGLKKVRDNAMPTKPGMVNTGKKTVPPLPDRLKKSRGIVSTRRLVQVLVLAAAATVGRCSVVEDMGTAKAERAEQSASIND